MTNAAKQLNRTSCSVTRFKMPDNMFKKDFLGHGAQKMTPTGKRGYALISSLSKKGKPAILTYQNYHEVLKCSTKTTNKFLDQLTESGKINQDKSNRMYCKYTVLKRPGGTGYITYDRAYFDIIDKHSKTPVHWTKSVEDIACLIIRYIISQGKERFAASIKKIANMVGISERSARYGIAELLKCKVIFRPKEYKGKYEGKSSEYRFGTALTIALMKYEEKYKAEAKAKALAKRARAKNAPKLTDAEETSHQDKPLPQPQEKIIAADFNTVRESFYAARQRKAFRRADKFYALAVTDEAFKAAESAIKKGEIELGRAEVHSPAKVPEIQMKLADARKARADALLRLNLAEEDLQPWTCPKCKDTGFLPNGKRCDCYDPPGGDP